MFTPITKILIGSAIVLGGAAVAVAVSSDKKEEKAKTSSPNKVKSIEEFKAERKAEEEDKSIVKRIKRYVKKKFVKFLTWVALHMQEIESTAAVIGLGSTVIGIVNAVRDFKHGNDLNAKVDELQRTIDQCRNDNIRMCDSLGNYIYECTEVLNDNLKRTDKDVIKLAEAQGVQILEEGEVFEA
ncbi:MAG: hypothetical protein J6U54_18015 [Clostridiales bacterium]|nr:hypothetical protein [Clostridiales bacterium]